MPPVSTSNKQIAQTALNAFGGKPVVTRFWDDERKSFVDILACDDRPEIGVTSYATLCLSDHPLYLKGEEYTTRVEIVGACRSKFSHFDNALATAAFCIVNSRWFCFPGAVFPDVLTMYDCSRTMRHFLFVPPFLWERKLVTLEFPEKTVAWLLAVPISDKELEFAEANGSNHLESLLAERDVDIFNLDRPSEA